MNPIQVAGKLYDARDTAKLFWGEEKYEKYLQLAVEVVKSKASADKTTFISAATSLAKEAQSEGHNATAILFLAAIVEESEK